MVDLRIKKRKVPCQRTFTRASALKEAFRGIQWRHPVSDEEDLGPAEREGRPGSGERRQEEERAEPEAALPEGVKAGPGLPLLLTEGGKRSKVRIGMYPEQAARLMAPRRRTVGEEGAVGLSDASGAFHSPCAHAAKAHAKAETDDTQGSTTSVRALLDSTSRRQSLVRLGM